MAKHFAICRRIVWVCLNILWSWSLKGYRQCFRSSHRRCSVIKKTVLKNFTIFTGQHLCWSLFLTKIQEFRCFLCALRTSCVHLGKSANNCFWCFNHTKTNYLICIANQMTGFYIDTLALNEWNSSQWTHNLNLTYIRESIVVN